jgi:hypothetical protein
VWFRTVWIEREWFWPIFREAGFARLSEYRQILLACLWNRIHRIGLNNNVQFRVLFELHLIQLILQAVAALDLAFPGKGRDMFACPKSEREYSFGRLSPRRSHR